MSLVLENLYSGANFFVKILEIGQKMVISYPGLVCEQN
jgi:hypothetical protein